MAADTINHLLQKLLLGKGRSSRLVVSLSALGTGLMLLLLSVLLWWNFNELLHGTRNDDSLGSSFLTVSKRVTAENMGQPQKTIFSAQEFAALQAAPEVQAAGAVLAVKPRVWLTMDIGPKAFSTILVLEAVPEAFMDKRSADWGWSAGQVQVPIILSSSFLSLYNYAFAPSQGLPQLSEETIKALPFKMEVGLSQSNTIFIGHVVGFSDRITSVLAPEAFVKWLNSQSNAPANIPLSRVILKVKDPSKNAFIQYIGQHGYTTNSEQLRLGKLRQIVEVIAATVGILALLLLGVSCILFILFIELTIAKAIPSIHRLLEQGYSPSQLSRFLQGKFLPMLALVAGGCILLCMLLQYLAKILAKDQQLNVPSLPGWPVWLVAIAAIALLMIVMQRAISKAISKVD